MSGGKTRTNRLCSEKENHQERRVVSIYYPYIVQFYLHDSFPLISRLSVEKAFSDAQINDPLCWKQQENPV